MARLNAVSRQIAVAADATIEEFHLHIAAVAKREHRAIMSADPRPNSYARYVDGVEGAQEEAVRIDGRIVYFYERMSEIVQYAMEVLFDLSPVDSGQYRNAHEIYINGLGSRDLKDWGPGMEVAITNRVPYARKIELGHMSMSVPGSDMVYQRARRKLLARFGNVIDVQFTYRAIVEGKQVDQQSMPSFGQPWYWGGANARGGFAGRQRDRNGRFAATGAGQVHNRSELRFPTIVLKRR